MRLPFEDGRRRRIYLMRHAQADYFAPDGARRPEPNAVPLTPQGRPARLKMLRMIWVVVVLPLVPVTPTNRNCVDGSP